MRSLTFFLLILLSASSSRSAHAASDLLCTATVSNPDAFEKDLGILTGQPFQLEFADGTYEAAIYLGVPKNDGIRSEAAFLFRPDHGTILEIPLNRLRGSDGVALEPNRLGEILRHDQQIGNSCQGYAAFGCTLYHEFTRQETRGRSRSVLIRLLEAVQYAYHYRDHQDAYPIRMGVRGSAEHDVLNNPVYRIVRSALPGASWHAVASPFIRTVHLPEGDFLRYAQQLSGHAPLRVQDVHTLAFFDKYGFNAEALPIHGEAIWQSLQSGRSLLVGKVASGLTERSGAHATFLGTPFTWRGERYLLEYDSEQRLPKVTRLAAFVRENQLTLVLAVWPRS